MLRHNLQNLRQGKALTQLQNWDSYQFTQSQTSQSKTFLTSLFTILFFILSQNINPYKSKQPKILTYLNTNYYYSSYNKPTKIPSCLFDSRYTKIIKLEYKNPSTNYGSYIFIFRVDTGRTL